MLLLMPMCLLSLMPANTWATPEDCNGMGSLCDVPTNEVNYAMVHNAMAATQNGFTLAANHLLDPIVEALDAGFRGLSLDICNCGDGNIQFCHGNEIVECSLGTLDPVDAFTEINNWVTANPNNVLVIALQMSSFNDGVSLEEVQSRIQQVDGFADKLYDHWPLEDSKTWPTLAELIDSGKQIVFFYFSGPSANPTASHLTGLNQWWQFVEATNYSWESPSEIESALIPDCPTTRGADSTGDFFLIEAFVTESAFGIQFQPSAAAAREINTVEFAGPIMDACTSAHDQQAAIFSVDFWSEGDLTTLVNQRNSRIGATPTLAPSTSPEAANPTPQPTSDTSGATQHGLGGQLLIQRGLIPLVALIFIAVTL